MFEDLNDSPPPANVRRPRDRSRSQADQSADDEGANDRRPPVENPLKPSGLHRLLFAGGAAVLAVLGLVHGAANLLPVLSAVIVAVIYGYRGLRLYLQPFAWPSRAPAGILGVRRNVGPLIRDLSQDDFHLGTYNLPIRFIEVIAYTVSPRLTAATPAARTLVRLVGWGLVSAVVYVMIGLILLADGSKIAGLLLIAGTAAIAGFRVYVLANLLIDNPPGAPVVVRLDDQLTEAGNPIELVKSIVRMTADHRDGDDTRMFDHGPTKLNTETMGEFNGRVAYETRPERVQTNPGYALAADQLEQVAVAAGLFALALYVLAPPAAGYFSVKVVGLFLGGMCGWMGYVAFRMRNTFRFVSDLVGVWLEGTYQYQKGWLHGAESAEVTLVKSSISVTVFGTRVVTECSIAEGPPLRSEAANVEALANVWSALTSPRYIVRTAVDQRFRDRLSGVAAAIRDHRDVYRDVVGINMDSPGAVRINQANLLRDQQQEVFKQQLLLQAQLQSQIMAKAMQGVTPEQAMQMLAQGGLPMPAAQLPAPPSPPPPPPLPAVAAPPVRVVDAQPAARPAGEITPELEKKLTDALRLYLGPTQPPEVKEMAKQLLDQLKKAHKLRSWQMQELAKKVRADLGLSSAE